MWKNFVFLFLLAVLISGCMYDNFDSSSSYSGLNRNPYTKNEWMKGKRVSVEMDENSGRYNYDAILDSIVRGEFISWGAIVVADNSYEYVALISMKAYGDRKVVAIDIINQEAEVVAHSLGEVFDASHQSYGYSSNGDDFYEFRRAIKRAVKELFVVYK